MNGLMPMFRQNAEPGCIIMKYRKCDEQRRNQSGSKACQVPKLHFAIIFLFKFGGSFKIKLRLGGRAAFSLYGHGQLPFSAQNAGFAIKTLSAWMERHYAAALQCVFFHNFAALGMTTVK